MSEELSIHIEAWGTGLEGVTPDELGDRLERLYDALERRDARGTIPSAGGLAGGPMASFGIELVGETDAVAIGRAVRKACKVFLDACTDAGIEHDGIAHVDVLTGRYLELEIEQPPETFAGASEVAELLGVSRQRVQELRLRSGFPAPAADLAAGPVWRVSTLNRFLADWERKPGRPRKATEG
jgi:hypothetical protein